MRCIRFLFIPLLGSSLLAAAQEPIRSSHFGLKIGPSVTTTRVSGVTSIIPKRKVDFNFGVMYRLRLNKFVLQPEVIYSRAGGTFQIPRVGSRETVKNNFNYVSVPLLLGYIPTEGITLQAGPQFSYALDTPNGPGQRRDLGIVVGAHYDFLDMLSQLSLHARYIYGLNNVAPTSAPGINLDYRNRQLQVAIVYNLYKKKK